MSRGTGSAWMVRWGVALEGALRVSAGVLGIVVLGLLAMLVRTPGLPLETIARAQSGQMVAAGEGYSILSTITGGEAMVLVQDARAETLTVYKADSQGVLQQVQRMSLQNVFVEGKARFGGRP